MIDLRESIEKSSINKILSDYKTIYGNKANHILNNGHSCYISLINYEIVIGLGLVLRYLLDIEVKSSNSLGNDKNIYYLSKDLKLRYYDTLKTRLNSDKKILSSYLCPMIESLFLHELSHKKYTSYEAGKTFSCGMSELIVNECIKKSTINMNKAKTLKIYIKEYFCSFENGIEDGRIEYLEKKDSSKKDNLFNFLRSYWIKYNTILFKKNESIFEILNNIQDIFCYIATIGKIQNNVRAFEFYKNVAEKYYNVIRESVTQKSHDKSLIIMTKAIKNDIDFWANLFSDLSNLISDDEIIEKKQAKNIFNPYQNYIPPENKRNENEKKELEDLFSSLEESQDDLNQEKQEESQNNSNQEKPKESQNNSNQEKQEESQDDSNQENQKESQDDSNQENQKENFSGLDFEDCINTVQENYYSEDNIFKGESNYIQNDECINSFTINSNLDGFSDYLGYNITVVESFIKKPPVPFVNFLDYIIPLKKERKRVNNKHKGKLDKGKLASFVSLNNNKIFYKNEGKNTNVCIEILVDSSGSMECEISQGISKMEQAIISCETAEKISMYVPMQIAYFNDIDQEIHLDIVKEFDERSSDSFVEGCKLIADGYNSDGVAIRLCVNHLKKRKERTKILIVISDGQPSGIAYSDFSIGINDVKNAVAYASSNGVIVIPIAILNEEERKSLQETYESMYGSIIMSDSENLGDILYDIINPLC